MASQTISQTSDDTKTIIVILLLLFAYPIGLVLMWVWMKEWPHWVKIVISLPIAISIFFIMLAFFLLGVGLWHGFDKNSTRMTGGAPYVQVSTTPTPQSEVMGMDEERGMYRRAREYVKNNSTPGLEFDVVLVKTVENKYALLKVIPLNMELDTAFVVMEKQNGVWQPQTMGTDFPDWRERVPQLFTAIIP